MSVLDELQLLDTGPCAACVREGADVLDPAELEACLRSHGASRPPFGDHHCPSCGRESVYVRQLDRYLHVDGSDHDSCWYLILARGAGW